MTNEEEEDEHGEEDDDASNDGGAGKIEYADDAKDGNWCWRGDWCQADGTRLPSLGEDNNLDPGGFPIIWILELGLPSRMMKKGDNSFCMNGGFLCLLFGALHPVTAAPTLQLL